jgi:hypothetical protein
MKLTVVLAAALVAAPALQATEKTGAMQPKAAPYWVKIDSIEVTRPGHVECFPTDHVPYVWPKPSQTVNVHISFSAPPDATLSAVSEAAAVGEAAPYGRGNIPLIPKGATKAVVPAYFYCRDCPAGKTAVTINRFQVLLLLGGSLSNKLTSPVLPANLVVDCTTGGPELQRPVAPTPVPQPHPVSPGAAVQKKN